jgi:hypothetical protein
MGGYAKGRLKMSVTESPVPPQFLSQFVGGLGHLITAAQWQASITLASAIVTASGRPHSIEQALDIAKDIHFETHPTPGSAVYLEWSKTKDAKLKKVHGVS